MGEHQDVWGGGGRPPRRQQELATLLSSGVFTLEAIASELEISQDDAGHILRRLKSRGFDIRLLYCGAEGEAPLYRILYPKGRVCASPGCETLLRQSNPSDRCEVHGGGVLELPLVPRPPRAAPRLRPERQPKPDTARTPPRRPTAPPPAPPRVTFDGAALRIARERKRLSLRQLAALAGVSPAYLSRLERGTRRPTFEVAERLAAALEDAPVYVWENWRALRRRADLSLREVARRTGVDAAVLSRVERGERRATRDVAGRLAETLGTTVARR